MKAHREFKTAEKVARKTLYVRPTEHGVFVRQQGQHATSAIFIKWPDVFKRAKSAAVLRESNERRRYKRIMRKLARKTRLGEAGDGIAVSEEDMFFIAQYQGRP